MPKLVDFECNECSFKFEDMIQNNWPDPVCPECDSEDLTEIIGGTITTMHDPEVKQKELMRRSENHTRDQQRKGNLPSIRDYMPKVKTGKKFYT